MKKLNYNLFLILVFVFSATLLSSCSGDEQCNGQSYEDSFVGKFWLLNFLELTNNDTISISLELNTQMIIDTASNDTTFINADSLVLNSAILGNEFKAKYNASTNSATVSNIYFPQFVIGGDTLFDISVQSGSVELDNNCDKLYINLDGVTVLSGTVNLPSGPPLNLGYPIENAFITTKNGFSRN